jgi:phytoene synthase
MSLDAAFVARAIPVGSARHWSYVFAPLPVRGPLLGVYALLAEWLALLDPATETTVAQIKLAWWQEEMTRLAQGSAVHPVSRYLESQPGAAPEHFSILTEAVQAAMLEISGVPLELGIDLQAHSTALLAGPLRVASLLARPQPDRALDRDALDRATQALSVAQYLTRSLREYRRAAASGRVLFAVDELLEAGVENIDLTASQAPTRLRAYLEGLRLEADLKFSHAASDVPPAARAQLRHLLVLAALERKHLHAPGSGSAFAALKDMLLAWRTARRAAQMNSEQT